MTRSRWIAVAGGIATALLLAAPLAAGPVAIPGGNLVQNPGAEEGPAAQLDAVSAPPGWETTGATSAWAYFVTSGVQSPDRPTAEVAASIGGGKAFFSGGLDAAVSTASQTIDVSGAVAEIDASSVAATLSAYIGGYGGSADTAHVDARFLGETGNALGSVRIGPVTRTDRVAKTTLLKRSATKPVPKGTRSIAVVMTMTMTDAPKNQGFVDNVSLTLGKASVSAPPATAKPTLVVACKGKTLVATVLPAKGSKVSSVVFLVGGKAVAIDKKAPFTVRISTSGRPATLRVSAKVTASGKTVTLTKSIARC